MSAVFSVGWLIIGIIWIIAGKDFLEVAACFLLFGVFMGVNELSLIRQELEDLEYDDN